MPMARRFSRQLRIVYEDSLGESLKAMALRGLDFQGPGIKRAERNLVVRMFVLFPRDRLRRVFVGFTLRVGVAVIVCRGLLFAAGDECDGNGQDGDHCICHFHGCLWAVSLVLGLGWEAETR